MARIGFVFPGQGAQYVGMGRALAEAYPVARELFARAGDALGTDLARLCFEGPEEELTKTANAQPAILTVAVAVAEVLSGQGVEAEAAAGLSLGEYSALVWARALAFEDAVRVVRLRGQFMQEAVPLGRGTMAAVIGLDAGVVVDLCRQASTAGLVEAANFNGPGQVAVSGEVDAVERVMELARQAGARRVQRLSVSAPFHCALLEPARIRLAEVLAGVAIKDPARPVVANVDGRVVRTAEEVRDALVRQVSSPVRWEDCVRTMAGLGIEVFVEPGPGKVLSGLVRRILPEARSVAVEEPGSISTFLESLGGVC